MFDKSKKLFPYKDSLNFLSFCSVSPMYGPGAAAGSEYFRRQSESGIRVFEYYAGPKSILGRFHSLSADLLATSSDDISVTSNTAEALNMIANGYPFEPGDEIISYIHEYPANHYPWKLQESRGVKLVLLSDCDPLSGIPEGYARGWSFSELEEKITKRTRVIALSHVQFTSGYAADLAKLGALCKENDIDLILDVAQSLGSLPLEPEKYGVAALASAGWKWLLGPVGIGLMYTSPEFRAKIDITMAGADHMTQGTDYLDHTFSPFSDGRKFEYSTLPVPSVEALSQVIEEVFLKYTVEKISEEIFRLQDIVLNTIDRDCFLPLAFEGVHRSGILSVISLKRSAVELSAELRRKGILLSERSGYLRFAPHFCTSDEEIQHAVELLNSL
jgi:selenocysteine lyase/cysteine desulfurase